MEDVITFEFSYFVSLSSTYPQAGQLYERYKDRLNFNRTQAEIYSQSNLLHDYGSLSRVVPA
ncbi:MAG TPA: hypothetical protein DDX07_09590 [Porphyromonadaceae bacterium]|jgi:hypothetical protein|nr:hypothetical protein [Porphyromonadaceae bacterium]